MSTTLTFLGHTSLSLKSGETQIVIDPCFTRKLLFLSRRVDPVYDAEVIKKTTAVLVSNAHPNRMDIASYKYFPLETRVLLPRGTQAVLGRFIEFNYDELASDDERTIGGIKITAIASAHRALRWSGLRYGLALHYIIETPDHCRIFYGTDAPAGPQFAVLADRFKIDCAILPVAHVGPTFTAGKRYLDVPAALRAFQDLRAGLMIPNAYGAFSLSGQTRESVLEELRSEAFKMNLKDKIKILAPGESIVLAPDSAAAA